MPKNQPRTMTITKSTSCIFQLSALLICSGCGSAGNKGDSAKHLPTPQQDHTVAHGNTIKSWDSENTLNVAAATPQETVSRGHQSWLGNPIAGYGGIHAPYAAQMGRGDGTGVVVGVLDSGVDANHPALAGKIVASKNFVTAGLGSSVPDTFGHGTAVAALIAGSLDNPNSEIRGVAPGAKLAVGKLGNDGDFPIDRLLEGMKWLSSTRKTPIINLSLGRIEAIDADTISAASATFRKTINKGTLLIVAAGNDSRSNQVSFPATFANQGWANGQIIVVGALTTDQSSEIYPNTTPNVRAEFSNYDPDMAAFTVYAPGVLVTTANSGMVPGDPGPHQRMSGTSASAPIVAGQAAVIKSNWKFLHASDVAGIIFQSATRICSDGSSAIVCAAKSSPDREYGWGVVNVAASLKPIGTLTVLSASGAAIRDFTSKSLATPRSGMASGLTGIQTLAVDHFNRAFKVSIAEPQNAMGADLDTIPGAPNTVPTEGTPRLAFSLRSVADGTELLSHGAPRAQAHGAMELGFNGSAAQYFGLHKDFTGWRNPYMELVGMPERHNDLSKVMHLGYTGQISGWTPHALTWRIGMLGAQPGGKDTAELALVEIASTLGNVEYAASLGHLHETNAILGLTGSGAMALSTTTDTRLFNFSGLYRPSTRYALAANIATGYTAATHNNAPSLINGTSETQSLAWSMGVELNQLMSARDSLHITVSMPLRTLSGSLGYTSADTQDPDTGALNFSSKNADLAPNGSERNVGLNYTHTFPQDLRSACGGCNLSTRVQMRWEPNHTASTERVFGVGVRLSKNF